MVIEITDEMRQAVYEDDCEREGHQPNISTMFGPPIEGIPSVLVEVIGPNDETFPHVSCNRCGYVWLVLPQAFKTYDEAVQHLNSVLRDPESTKPKKRKKKVKETPSE